MASTSAFKAYMAQSRDANENAEELEETSGQQPDNEKTKGGKKKKKKRRAGKKFSKKYTTEAAEEEEEEEASPSESSGSDDGDEEREGGSAEEQDIQKTKRKKKKHRSGKNLTMRLARGKVAENESQTPPPSESSILARPAPQPHAVEEDEVASASPAPAPPPPIADFESVIEASPFSATPAEARGMFTHEASDLPPVMAPPGTDDTDGKQALLDEISSLNDKLNKSDKLVSSLKEDVASFKTKNDTLSEEVEGLYGEILDHQTKFDQQEEKHNELKDKYTSLVQSNAALAFERDELVKERANSDARRQASDTPTIKAKDDRIASLTRELGASRAEQKSTQAEYGRVDKLQEENGRLVVELKWNLENRNSEIKRIEGQYRSLQEERNQLLEVRGVIEDYFKVADLGPDILRGLFSKYDHQRQGLMQSLEPKKTRAVNVDDHGSGYDKSQSSEDDDALAHDSDGPASNSPNHRKARVTSLDMDLPDDHDSGDEGSQSGVDVDALAPGQNDLVNEEPESDPRDPSQYQQAEQQKEQTSEQQQKPVMMENNSFADSPFTIVFQDPSSTTSPSPVFDQESASLFGANSRTFLLSAVLALLFLLYKLVSERSMWLAANELTRQNVVSIRDRSSWMGWTDSRLIMKFQFWFEQMSGVNRGLLG